MVKESVLEAIRDGNWDYEPAPVSEEMFHSTQALPGTRDKVKEMADRVRSGLPLWHSGDRRYFDDEEK